MLPFFGSLTKYFHQKTCISFWSFSYESINIYLVTKTDKKMKHDQNMQKIKKKKTVHGTKHKKRILNDVKIVN